MSVDHFVQMDFVHSVSNCMYRYFIRLTINISYWDLGWSITLYFFEVGSKSHSAHSLMQYFEQNMLSLNQFEYIFGTMM